MSLVVASQLENAFNEQIAGHACRPTVIAAPESEPWSIAGEADVLIVRPTPAWRNAPRDHAPPGWPSRLRWIFRCSVGIDFYPAWLLDGPKVSCARGTASEEIANYVIAAIQRLAPGDFCRFAAGRKCLIGAQCKTNPGCKGATLACQRLLT